MNDTSRGRLSVLRGVDFELGDDLKGSGSPVLDTKVSLACAPALWDESLPERAVTEARGKTEELDCPRFVVQTDELMLRKTLTTRPAGDRMLEEGLYKGGSGRVF